MHSLYDLGTGSFCFVGFLEVGYFLTLWRIVCPAVVSYI